MNTDYEYVVEITRRPIRSHGTLERAGFVFRDNAAPEEVLRGIKEMFKSVRCDKLNEHI